LTVTVDPQCTCGIFLTLAFPAREAAMRAAVVVYRAFAVNRTRTESHKQALRCQ
jgi:hypothetical protein